ncbi:twin-arginine translocase TatA/TatE family subunit [Mitsuokella sp.]|uniref:twin-arginine translocase TatA/TatE family subunit n=1 Tax=unclassified Mitsuokella TaxID=2637239 RepID=UPI003D7E2A7B
MFGLGVPELVLILIIGLVIFGPGKLPDVGKALGKSIREFKSASAEEDKKADDKMIDVTAQTKEIPPKKDEQK